MECGFYNEYNALAKEAEEGRDTGLYVLSIIEKLAICKKKSDLYVK